ncbi:MAG: hypothetical protein DMG97_43240 [Acidobacteria bacterium]|nr:MAG: hypothetical protein DMG97_43240 [Acidobacteriota bacterium]
MDRTYSTMHAPSTFLCSPSVVRNALGSFLALWTKKRMLEVTEGQHTPNSQAQTAKQGTQTHPRALRDQLRTL